MSKSTLKLKHFEIFNLSSYFQSLSDDIMQEEEDIVDIIYEVSEESKFIFTFLVLLSKGTLMYFEYNTTTKKMTNIFTNAALSMITNEITCAELSYNSPIILATTLNELILLDTKQKPCQMINITEEGIILSSIICDSQILDIQFNCNQSIILVMTVNKIKVFKIGIDKYENKNILQWFIDIKPIGLPLDNIDYGTLLYSRLFPKFSNFNDNVILISYLTDDPILEVATKISLDNDDTNLNIGPPFYLNIAKIVIGKKEAQTQFFQSYTVDKTFVKVEFSYFYEKMFFLYQDGIICCVNSSQINYDKPTDHITNAFHSLKKPNRDPLIFDDKLVFKYQLSMPSVKFTDIYVHPSSNFIVIRDSEGSFLIFDFTLNLYYIMHNSQITVKLKMDSFDKGEGVYQMKFKASDINYFMKNFQITQTQSNVVKTNSNLLSGNSMHSIPKIDMVIDDYKIERSTQNAIFSGKFKNNSMFFNNSRVIQGIFIEISSKFNQKNCLNPILDEFQLLKNHIRGQNFDSSFKILGIIQSFSQWIQALFLIINKLCHSPTNILTIKRHSFASTLQYLKEKTFDDEIKNATVANIRNLCFTNLVLRCLSIRQYEYAFLIAEKLQLPLLFKIIISHSRLSKYLGVNYLSCSKLEENSSTNNENEDSVINDLNKIITSCNFVLSQNNIQVLIKDVDQLLENNNLSNDYLKEYNSLEINLTKYFDALQLEVEGKFEEAKEMYKQNGLNYDYMRVEKINKELLNQMSDDTVIEFTDI